MGGYLALHREIFDKPIWLKSSPEQKVVLITLMGMANFKENEWEWKGEKFKVNPGQFITSLDKIIIKCGKGISIQNVRSALKRFEKLHFLTNESTKTGRLLTIVNWGVYQDSESITNKATNKELTKNQQRGNKELTPKKNDNKDEKDDTDNNINTNSEFDIFFNELWDLYPYKKGKGSVKPTQRKKLFKIGIEEMTRATKRYVKDKEDWKAWQQGSTFFNTSYIDYLDKNYTENSNTEKKEEPKQKHENGLYTISSYGSMDF